MHLNTNICHLYIFQDLWNLRSTNFSEYWSYKINNNCEMWDHLLVAKSYLKKEKIDKLYKSRE